MSTARRRIDPAEGSAALAAWQAASGQVASGPADPAKPEARGPETTRPESKGPDAAADAGADDGRQRTGAAGTQPGTPPSRAVIAMAVRYSLEELTARAPGNSVEVRVPPFGVTQCVEGPRHTRGTPPNVIECDAGTWLELVTGRLGWAAAVDAGRVAASGLRADLSELLPLL